MSKEKQITHISKDWLAADDMWINPLCETRLALGTKHKILPRYSERLKNIHWCSSCVNIWLLKHRLK